MKNYDQVLSAIRAMTDGNRFGLAPSRITLSTVGIIPKMLELTRDIPSIQLALSLHAPTQELRQEIVPSAKSYPIEKLVEAMQYFIDRSKKRILVEYVLLDGVNASEKEAHQLGQLLKGMDVVSTQMKRLTRDSSDGAQCVTAFNHSNLCFCVAQFSLCLDDQFNSLQQYKCWC